MTYDDPVYVFFVPEVQNLSGISAVLAILSTIQDHGIDKSTGSHLYGTRCDGYEWVSPVSPEPGLGGVAGPNILAMRKGTGRKECAENSRGQKF